MIFEKFNFSAITKKRLLHFNSFFLFYCLFYFFIFVGFAKFAHFWIFRAHLNRDFLFQDLWAILWVSEHLDSLGGRLVYQPINELGGTSYTNGYFGLVLFNSLGLNSSNFIIMSLMLIISMIWIFSYLTLNLQNKKIGIRYLILAFCSPSIWFLFERSNTDIIIMTLLFLACYLIKKQELLSILIIFLTVLMKHYTLLILFLLPFIVKKRKNIFIASVLCILSLLNFIIEWSMIVYEKPWTLISSFGSTNLGIWINKFSQYFFQLNFLPSKFSQYVFGLTLFLLFSYLIYRNLKIFNKALPKLVYSEKYFFINYLLLFSGFTYLFLFISPSTVYDYKLVFFIFTGIILLHRYNRKNSIVYKTFFLIALWSSGWGYSPNDQLFILLQLVSDICIFFFSCLILNYTLANSFQIIFRKDKLEKENLPII